MSAPEIEHGTTRGYRAHLRLGDEPCPPCREANRLYMRELRARDPRGRYKENVRRSAARARALTRLGHRYPDELAELWADELRQDELMQFFRGEK